jgi:hypothetical protein
MNHLIFQIILLLALIALILYVFRLRTLMTDRLVFLALALIGFALIINPDLTTWIAHQVSLGRGTDLVFYIFIIASLFYAITTTARLRQIQRQLTLIVRQVALSQPIAPLQKHPAPNQTSDEDEP